MNEIVVQRLLQKLGINHLEYTLIHSIVIIDGKEQTTYVCESEDYKEPGENKLSIEDYYAMEKEGDETPFEFCTRLGWETYVYEMFLIDYLVLNRDNKFFAKCKKYSEIFFGQVSQVQRRRF